MNPLIRIQPTKDGGRRMLTDECKATVAAWLRMMRERYIAQLTGIRKFKPPEAGEKYTGEAGVLERRIDTIWLLIANLDCAFDSDEFTTSFNWALEVMYGKPDDTAGSGQTGDAIGPCQSPA